MKNIEKKIEDLKELLSNDTIDADACINLLTRIESDIIDIVDENDSYQDEVWDLEEEIDSLEWKLDEKESEIDKFSFKPLTLNDEFKLEIFQELNNKYYTHWQLEKLLKEANIL